MRDRGDACARTGLAQSQRREALHTVTQAVVEHTQRVVRDPIEAVLSAAAAKLDAIATLEVCVHAHVTHN
jgi:hypothetical protein